MQVMIRDVPQVWSCIDLIRAYTHDKDVSSIIKSWSYNISIVLIKHTSMNTKCKCELWTYLSLTDTNNNIIEIFDSDRMLFLSNKLQTHSGQTHFVCMLRC